MSTRPDVRTRAEGRTDRRRGFTLIELIVVAVLGALLLTATYNVLITNQRTYQVQGIQVTNQQSLRLAVETLANEVRELSARDGDLLSTNASQLTIRVLEDFALACDASSITLLTPVLRVKKMSNWIAQGDSVYVFADNDETLTSDDTWLKAYVSAIDTTVSCNGTDKAQNLYFSGQLAKFTGDDVLQGAPVRTFKRYQYSVVTWNSQQYLARQELPSGSTTPMIGPFYDRRLANAPSGSPVTFRYFDAGGSTTATAADVRRIDITVRTWSPVEDGRGNNVKDSLTVSVYTRN